ncbi:MAG: SigE family RNA polymerase sigma factor [bacterium]|nr:SigE family RNA polymerase sigma factor [bacterium]
MGTLTAATYSEPGAPAEVLDSRVIAEAFDEFYRTEYLAMVRLAYGLLDTPEAAEEIAQDAFAKVFERWGRLRNPGGYLRTAVLNGARSELRKREVRRRILPGQPQQAPAQQDYLLDALERLPTRRKTALVLRYYGDLSEKEIAETMGIRPGTVKSLLAGGLAQLREVIDR